MKNTCKRKPLAVGAIASRGEMGMPRVFSRSQRMMGQVQRVNVDLASLILKDLDLSGNSGSRCQAAIACQLA